VIEALRPHNLTLPNLASIAEQQMGGFIQVGAHGTGRQVAPVDEYVSRLKMVTPGKGTVVLTKEDHGRLFELARVGLGCLGVVTEITMECIPAHRLVEHTFVLTRKEAMARKDQLLKDHKHMRFMWIPYTDAVVVVTNDPEDQVPDHVPRDLIAPGTLEERNKPLTDLLKKLCQENGKQYVPDEVKTMGFGELRGEQKSFELFVFRLLNGQKVLTLVRFLETRRSLGFLSFGHGTRQEMQHSRSRFLETQRRLPNSAKRQTVAVRLWGSGA
jgi:L-galactono-1,4-lactone dehydrogenase